MTRAYGGKAVYGASVGMLLLETRFPRIPGDGGNAATWPFPVLWRVVSGATPDRVVRDRGGVVEDFVAAGRELVALGADGITTNCGFLVLHQERLARECGVPVAASSLLQVPWVERLLPLEKLDLSGSEAGTAREFFYEPTEAEIFAELLPRHVEYQIWRALLESVAAEQAARMTAMDNATKNASELIADLTLTMNRVRQAAITKEILEVVGGAEALD